MSLSVSGLTPANANLPLPGDPKLRLGEIQGDVLVGLQKDEEIFLFFKILDLSVFRSVMRAKVLPGITTTQETLARELQIKAAAAAGNKQRLPFVGLNLAFTHPGLVLLMGAKKCTGLDVSFMAGAAAQAASLNDPVDAKGKPVWTQGFAADVIHGVFLVAGPARPDTAPTSLAQVEAGRIKAALGASVTIVFEQTGQTRPDRGHEHFGFLDGVSNPGVRGLTARANPADENQGVPGQDLLWPGEFVFGYSGQDPNKPFEEEGPPPKMGQPWLRDGSYMVFRRLNQLVPEFADFLDAQGKLLGMDPALIGARMVGRWKSGAPVMIAPLQDDPVLGDDATRNNKFEYSQDTAERRCPFAGHIRKAYPRDDLEDPNTIGLKNPEGFVQTHRIMRAGIPFGPEVDEQKEPHKTIKERGLLFVCYQTSIVDQFEFVQDSWANDPTFPPKKTRPDGHAATPGHDPIIGQVPVAPGKPAGPRAMEEIVPNYPVGAAPTKGITMPNPFVVPTAAAYFFMPAVSVLWEIAA